MTTEALHGKVELSLYLLKWAEVGNRHTSTNVTSGVEILHEINSSSERTTQPHPPIPPWCVATTYLVLIWEGCSVVRQVTGGHSFTVQYAA